MTFDIDKQISLFEREIVLNDLKNILTDELLMSKNVNQYNII